MAKENNNAVWIAAIIVIGILIAGQQGWFDKLKIGGGTPNTPFPGAVEHEYLTYSASISLVPNNVCVGDGVTGSINSNIPNGICTIFQNPGTGYVFLMNANLDANGKYSETRVIEIVGTTTVVAVCCDTQGNCKLSNTVELTSRACDSDGDGIPDETDPDDDNDGYPDEQEIAAGTDPKDPNSHPGGEASDPCPIYCKGVGAYSTGRFVTSPGYCSSPEISFPYPPKSGYCCCMPKNQQTSYTCGQGSDKGVCQGTCPTSYSCSPIESETAEWCACITGGDTGSVHPDWKPGAQYYNPTMKPTEYCSDSDGGNVLTSQGTCTDLWGSHTDACIGTGFVDEKYCEGTVCGGNSFACPSGKICSNGACVTQTAPTGLPPGTGWSSLSTQTNTWYMPSGNPDYYYPFYWNAGSIYVAIKYDFSHWQTGNFIDTTNPSRIRVSNNGVVIPSCTKTITTNAERSGTMLCVGTTTNNWKLEVNNAKTENINTAWGYYTWAAG